MGADVFWCCYCLVGGIGCTKDCNPCCTGSVNVLTLEAVLRDEEFCGPKGFLNVALKLCCCGILLFLPPGGKIGMNCCCLTCVEPSADAREIEYAGYVVAPEESPAQQAM